MTTKDKGRVRLHGGATPKTSASHNHTESDPLMGWFNLAKPSRDRQQKKSWKRKQRGQVCLPMVANLLLTAAALVLFIVALMGWAK